MPQALASTGIPLTAPRHLSNAAPFNGPAFNVQGAFDIKFDALLEIEKANETPSQREVDSSVRHNDDDSDEVEKDQDETESDGDAENAQDRGSEDQENGALALAQHLAQTAASESPDLHATADGAVQSEISQVTTLVQDAPELTSQNMVASTDKGVVKPTEGQNQADNQTDAMLAEGANPVQTSSDTETPLAASPLLLVNEDVYGETTSARGYNPFVKPGSSQNGQSTSEPSLADNKVLQTTLSATSPQSDLPNSDLGQGKAPAPQAMPTTNEAAPLPFFTALDSGLSQSQLGTGASQSMASVEPSAVGAPTGPSNGQSLTDIPTVTVRAQTPGSRPQIPTPDVAAQISKHAEAGINRFQIRLDPPELGRIDIRLEIGDNGQMNAHLSADKQETLDLLQKDAKALEKALQDLGMDADEGSLEFSLRQNAHDAADQEIKGRGDGEGESEDQTRAEDIQTGELLEPVFLDGIERINLVI